MADGPVSMPRPAPSWKLRDDVAACTQGYVVTGFGDLPNARALFLKFGWADNVTGADFLRRLFDVAPITSAVPPPKGGPKQQSHAAALCFTASGLRRLGLPKQALASFSRPFREGMLQEDRLRRLGDRRKGDWLEGVVEGGPVWSGNAPPREPPPASTGAFDVPHHAGEEEHVRTALTVHALLLLYAADAASVQEWAEHVQPVLDGSSVELVRSIDLVLNIESGNFSREHFGFADALSQPLPFDATTPDRKAVLVDGSPAEADPVQGVPLGDFLIGYNDSHHGISPGPVVIKRKSDEQPVLQSSDHAEGFLDLGRNGSYVVVRELKQDVPGFWNSMELNARAMRECDPKGAAHITGEWLASRVIGRDRDGHMLCPGGRVAASCSDGSPDSSMRFYATDPRGEGCPPGSHVRRAFPRDALTVHPGEEDTLLQAANSHRILRRGRKFGSQIADATVDDGIDRGLLFMCVNTDIERQFEFVQQTWLLNNSFATLFKEVDPLLGPAGRMTLRDGGLRRMATVDTFVRFSGGDYFFLPSLPALQYLASL